MATYISLCHYTAEGIKAIKEAPKRLDKAKGARAQARRGDEGPLSHHGIL
jgi:uncharacterized protein with GYD domain